MNPNFLELALTAYKKINPPSTSQAVVQGVQKTLPEVCYLPTVRELLSVLTPLPSPSILVGTGDDDLPFLLDLDRPDIGSILISGDTESGKTFLLQAMVESVALLNSPREVRYAVITNHPEEWQTIPDISNTRQSLGCFRWRDRATYDLINKLSILAEERQHGNPKGAAMVLFIDYLNPVQDTSFEIQSRLHTLLDHGPFSKVWPVVSLNANQALTMPYWTAPFRTRLIGKIKSNETADKLAVHPGIRADTLEAGTQFLIWFEENWSSFWVPNTSF